MPTTLLSSARTVESRANVDSSNEPVMEATKAAEDEWTEVCDKISADSLFRKTDSCKFGSNVAGKKHAVLFYFAGIAAYRQVLNDVVRENYRGFRPF